MRLKHITFQLFSLTTQINFPLLLNESKCNPSCLGFCHFHKLLSPKKHLCCEILLGFFFSTLISVEFYSLPSCFIQLLWFFYAFCSIFVFASVVLGCRSFTLSGSLYFGIAWPKGLKTKW